MSAIDAGDGSLRGRHEVPGLRLLGTAWQESSIEEISIGLDIAKSVFKVHAISAAGTVVVPRLKRRYVL